MAALQQVAQITAENLQLWECPYYTEEAQKSEISENRRPVSLRPHFEGDLTHKKGITGNYCSRTGNVTAKAPML